MNLRPRSITLITLFALFQSLQLHAQVWEYPSSGNTSFSGKVGIGTTTPGLDLDVTGGIAASYPDLRGFVSLWYDNAIVWKHGNNNGGLRFGSGNNLAFQGWSEKMRISDNGYLGIGTTTPASWLDIVTGTGDGTTNEVNCIRLRQNSTTSNTQLLQMGVSNVAAGGNNNGYGYISSVYWGGSDNSPLALNPKGGPVGFGINSGINWNATAKDAVAIRANGSTANNTLMGKLVFAHWGTYTGNSSFIAGVYDKAAFYQGAGMVFHTISGSDIAGQEGIERMRISSDGNVGIGTSNPTEKLSIQSSTGHAVNMALRNTDGTSLLSLATDGVAQSSISSYYGLTFNSINSPFYSFKLCGNEYFRIDGSGNIGMGGIGTPQARLHIVGGVQAQSGPSVIYDKGTGDKQFYLCFYGDGISQAFIGQPANVSNRLDLGTRNGSSISMTLLEDNVGIGTITPQAKLHIKGGVLAQAGPSMIFDKGASSNQFYQMFYGENIAQAFIGLPSNVSKRLDLGTGDANVVMTLLEGNVGIGTTTPQSKLAVNGTVCATKVRVSPTGCWADYVFDNGYKLRSLAEVEQYINQHRHLPEVPGAAEVEKNGLDVGENQATLLKKIEELTLYVIEQNKKLESQQQQIDQLKKEVRSKK
jgi:hypothetical protein